MQTTTLVMSDVQKLIKLCRYEKLRFEDDSQPNLANDIRNIEIKLANILLAIPEYQDYLKSLKH